MPQLESDPGAIIDKRANTTVNPIIRRAPFRHEDVSSRHPPSVDPTILLDASDGSGGVCPCTPELVQRDRKVGRRGQIRRPRRRRRRQRRRRRRRQFFSMGRFVYCGSHSCAVSVGTVVGARGQKQQGRESKVQVPRQEIGPLIGDNGCIRGDRGRRPETDLSTRQAITSKRRAGLPCEYDVCQRRTPSSELPLLSLMQLLLSTEMPASEH